MLLDECCHILHNGISVSPFVNYVILITWTIPIIHVFVHHINSLQCIMDDPFFYKCLVLPIHSLEIILASKTSCHTLVP
jgi:hypothetical protein